MAQQHIAGAIIIDQLRDRIMTGLYLGRWEPGERLPSIRDVAGVENVDRKTAAAAYRRLQQEGLVRVRPRSGVYLLDQTHGAAGGPLERLYQRWLENLYDGAGELGLDTPTILRLFASIAEIEQRRIPVVDEDWTQAEAVAQELRQRLSLKTIPLLLEQVRRDDAVCAAAPFLVTTPYHRPELVATGWRVVETTLSRKTFKALRRQLPGRRVLLVVPSEAVAARTHAALENDQLLEARGTVDVVLANDRERLAAMAAAADGIFVWPGGPSWVAEELRNYDCVVPAHFLSDSTLTRVRQALLDTAIRHAVDSGGLKLRLNSTSADEPPARTAAAVQ